MQEVLGIHNVLDSLAPLGTMTRLDRAKGRVGSLATRAAQIHNRRTEEPYQPESDLNESLF